MTNLHCNSSARTACILLLCVCTGSGCQQQAEEDSQSFGTMSVGRGTVIYSRYQGRYRGEAGGQTVIICCDFQGNASVAGGQGSLSSADGKRRIDWHLVRTAGWNFQVRVNGQEYDAAQGGLFLVKVEADRTQVEQVARDLSAVGNNTRTIEELARNDPAVSTLLGFKAN